MLRSFVSRLLSRGSSKASSDEDQKTRRNYARHDTDRCVVSIRGHSFRVLNWGLGGMEIAAEDGTFKEGQHVAMLMKFTLNNTDLEIMHQGVVIRSYNSKTSIRFNPLKQVVKNGFQKVIDDEHARRQEKPTHK